MCTSNLASMCTSGLSPSLRLAVILSLPSVDVSTRLAEQPGAPPHVPLPQAPTVAALQPLPGP